MFVDGKYKIKSEDINQGVVVSENRRTVKCNPFAKKQSREKQNVSHDAKSKRFYFYFGIIYSLNHSFKLVRNYKKKHSNNHLKQLLK